MSKQKEMARKANLRGKYNTVIQKRTLMYVRLGVVCISIFEALITNMMVEKINSTQFFRKRDFYILTIFLLFLRICSWKVSMKVTCWNCGCMNIFYFVAR